ncbi:MAG: hypothetical protein HN952_06005 [Candidatus Cloacimonetes bacterium]|jgi:hypothetical protein|nr:hypothetical protein [Candidatus Cloacimonadota bacterium]MBT5420464.1 hypothetical protein [Candidatus Cloacimonadota bacterium]MBT6994493.1 hypothetical protein [Candidatus Cloacimonadota bacterium]MBT7468960.1 hypothetical protein [Candidatus Cloacimonadota bacterium]
MENSKIDKSQRLFFAVSAIVIWLGIYLTGFRNAHWILYIPAVSFVFAVITGFCPGMMFAKMIFEKNDKTT